MVVAEAACQEHKLVLRHSEEVCSALLSALAQLACAAEGNVRVSALRLLTQLAASHLRTCKLKRVKGEAASASASRILTRVLREDLLAASSDLLRDFAPVPHFTIKLMELAFSADESSVAPLLSPLKGAIAACAEGGGAGGESLPDRAAADLLTRLR